MNTLLTFSLTVFTGFFAVMNPIANAPIFLGLVEDADEKTRKDISKKSTITAFIIILAFVIFGKLIFQLFGITIPAFKITGGILIFFVGFDMLKSKESSLKHIQIKVNADEGIAVSPLAIPILAGPGTIVTAMNFVANVNYVHMAIVIGIFAFMCYLNYIAFNLSESIVEKMGSNLILVIGKIMGLIIAIIGANMVIEGIKMAFLS